MALPGAINDLRMRTLNLVHRGVLVVSGGRLGTTAGHMPVYKVTTTGRRSGRPHSVLLTSPVHDDDQWVFVASKAGDDRDPDWYRNLVATPEIIIEPAGGGTPLAVVARTASAEEKAELWPRIVASYRGYDRYEHTTERDIPVVVVEPRTG
jgi:deazaflavin-dependent oxidoreductase (nitroreductase family)